MPVDPSGTLEKEVNGGKRSEHGIKVHIQRLLHHLCGYQNCLCRSEVFLFPKQADTFPLDFITLPKNDNTKLLITTAAQQLLAGKMTLAALRAEMTRLAMQLPEYNTVRAMYGVGETTAAQLMAEIGDVRRFPRRSSIVGFAGVDPGVDDSGKHSAKSVPTTKRGSPHLRKTLYQIVCTYLRKAPANELVYQFLEKKRAEGKPYFVYMTAAQNKFLRIYYARVKECLAAFDAQQDTTQS